MSTLEAVRELLSDPERWTRGAFARDANGKAVSATDANAVCWCVAGAIRKVESGWMPGSDAYRALYQALGEGSVSGWQDNASHEEVMALLDRVAHGERKAGK